MRESGYYPPGAEFDPRAPYNQHEPELECSIISREIEEDILIIELEWTADGSEWVGDDTVTDFFNLETEFHLDASKFASYSDDEICEYIEINLI